jgi:dipeptidyl aminopeptidase/acylaminoacyl peptidase
MRMIFRATLTLVLLVALGAARAADAPSAAPKGLPPLIDRQLLFGDPDIVAPQLSPDGKLVAFLRPNKGTRNIWVKRIDQPFDQAKPITAETTRPIAGYFWSRDGKFVLFVRDQGGDENFNVYAVNPNDTPAAGSDVPAARNLTNVPKVRAVIYSVPRSDPDVIYVGLNDRDPAWHDLYRVHISSGQRELVRKNTDRFTGAYFDWKDELRLVTRSAENGDNEILRVDPQGGVTKIYSCTVLETCGPASFHKDGKRVYLVTNKGDDANLVGLSLLNVETGATELVESDPLKRVDLGGTRFSEVLQELVVTGYADERTRLYWHNAEREADYKLIKAKLGDVEISTTNETANEQLSLIVARSDVEPGAFYLFDRKTKALTPQFRIMEPLPRASLAQRKPIKYKSSDGLEIPAYLTLPKGVAAKSLPLIVVPHGGPWARDNWGFDVLAQFYANRGFAVLQPNFRGSTGYGKRFLNAGNLQWGDKMQDDITWGVKHLISTGVADPKRVAIMGGSYGGYATLAGVAFTPDLYAAAVSYVGPSNLLTLLNSIPAYWEAGRKQFYMRMGDPNTPAGKAQLMRQSPLNSASRIKTPLMVVQGANDPRVNKAESDQIVVALRDKGFPVEYYVAPDEGHGFAKPVNNMAAFAATERFFAKRIPGLRYQADMTPEVTQRLAELTVDPKTVQLAKAVDPASRAVAKASRPLQAGKTSYKGTIEVNGQKIDFTSVEEIRKGPSSWTVVDTVSLPQGVVTDQAELALEALTLQKRSVAQGPVNIDYVVKDGKATGEMKMNGQARPLSLDIGGESLADGPGSGAVVGTFPLAEGYATSVKTVNLQSGQVIAMDLKVSGSERIKVPGAEADCFKVELASTDGNKITYWIAKDSRQMLKVISVLAALGGAVITQEMT